MRAVGLFLFAVALAGVGEGAVAAPATDRFKDPNYLCDGRIAPPSQTQVFTEALIGAATAGVLGLLIPFPGDNPKPAYGQAGLDACTIAIAQATHDIRRAQLTLARSIHRIELKDYAGALDEAKAAPALAGRYADEPGFKRSLGRAALAVQGVALAGLGRYEEAQSVGLQIAETSPLDVRAIAWAYPFSDLTDPLTPAKRAYFETAAKLDPKVVLMWAQRAELVGDFPQAAAFRADYHAYAQQFDAISAAGPESAAGRALAYALAGDAVRSEVAAGEALAALDPVVGVSLDSGRRQIAEELLDHRQVALLIADGRLAEARARVLARKRWKVEVTPSVLWIIEALRPTATPAELKGLLAVDAKAVRAQDLKIRRDWVTNRATVERLFQMLVYEAPTAYGPVAARVWTLGESSPFIVTSRDISYSRGKMLKGDVFQLPDFRSDLGRQALLLHAALRARARGATAFALGPAGHSDGDAALWVVYRDPADGNFPIITALDPEMVIAALAPRIPRPTQAPSTPGS
ncbi:MAG: hypothetical protein KKE02_09005 [Alphaproteobacteria bacterium]|nr:hypothetical protein [Alphaproteobacteria bacterium]MBU1514160.1 hypothetical protein [Alphaproteobacteria bacterium]MBU2096191.1 hypothetical protein [Alphaproteobacteria bacterium]MBU2151145.1 hypothetical protein [Alphaproteobacteria bacterium]MBU2307196.1 hypothetical protein [Alphaproteobacteria bacterium]